jgi:hypothetical protein
MPRGFEDAVRAYQLPAPATGQSYLSQYGLSPNIPITVTAGFGGSLTAGQIGQGLSPPVILGAAHFDITITYYVDQSAVEAKET